MKTEDEINAEVNRLSELAEEDSRCLDIIQTLNWVLGEEPELPY